MWPHGYGRQGWRLVDGIDSRRLHHERDRGRQLDGDDWRCPQRRRQPGHDWRVGPGCWSDLDDSADGESATDGPALGCSGFLLFHIRPADMARRRARYVQQSRTNVSGRKTTRTPRVRSAAPRHPCTLEKCALRFCRQGGGSPAPDTQSSSTDRFFEHSQVLRETGALQGHH